MQFGHYCKVWYPSLLPVNSAPVMELSSKRSRKINNYKREVASRAATPRVGSAYYQFGQRRPPSYPAVSVSIDSRIQCIHMGDARCALVPVCGCFPVHGLFLIQGIERVAFFVQLPLQLSSEQIYL